MAKALRNADLYARLCNMSGGRNNVGIHDAGVPAQFVKRSLGGENNAYLYENVGLSRGEQFSINCPFCSDDKQRCYVHHLYATPDEAYNHGFIRLWRCFNEECQSDYDNRLAMMKLVTDSGRVGQFMIDKRVNVKPVDEKPSWPGVMRTFASLAESDPSHYAIRWCMARNIDIDRLIATGVRYCELGKKRFPYATDRIVVPFYRRNAQTKKPELVGWTARILRPRGDNDPKWVHASAPTKKIVLGLTGAVKSPISMWVEGPGDWWSAGTCSGAILGKVLSRDKARVIAHALRKHPVPGRVNVILLDPDMSPDAVARGDRHHIEKSADELRKVTDEPVVPVYLPPGADPGELMTGYIHDTVIREVYDAGFKQAAEEFDARRFDYTGRSRGNAAGK